MAQLHRPLILGADLEAKLREMALNTACAQRFEKKHNHGFVAMPTKKAPSVMIGGKRVSPLRGK